MTVLVNLTPHALTLRAPDGTDTVPPPSGVVARVTTTPGAPGAMDGVPVPVYGPTTFGAVEGLPCVAHGGLYVVSGAVLAALKGTREDVVGPGTGPNDGAVRNEKGHIIAVTRLVRG